MTTTRRSIRIKDNPWFPFLHACREAGLDGSHLLRDYAEVVAQLDPDQIKKLRQTVDRFVTRQTRKDPAA